MMNLKKLLKVASVNAFMIASGFLMLELCIRAAKVRPDLTSPRAFARSISAPLLNLNLGHLDRQNHHRRPHPYIMFKGAPYSEDHNHLGFRIARDVPNGSVNIAFFGGSTGYNGNPPIATLITDSLNNTVQGSHFFPLNYSVVSSIHNQHLHSLLTHYSEYPIDLVIFYGGNNEIVGPAYQDPRPGFPYNFYIRNEMEPEQLILWKHFHIYRQFHKVFWMKDLPKPFTPSWTSDVKRNYIQTIKEAALISPALTTGKCKVPFVFIFQPFQLQGNRVLSGIKQDLSAFARQSKIGIDVSSSLDNNETEFIDPVHVTAKGRRLIAESILSDKVFKSAIDSCIKGDSHRLQS